MIHKTPNPKKFYSSTTIEDAAVSAVDEGVPTSHLLDKTHPGERGPYYDYEGAMLFAIVVISIYGMSIALLVGSSVNGDKDEDEIKALFSHMEQLRGQRRKLEKNKTEERLRTMTLSDVTAGSSQWQTEDIMMCDC